MRYHCGPNPNLPRRGIVDEAGLALFSCAPCRVGTISVFMKKKSFSVKSLV